MGKSAARVCDLDDGEIREALLAGHGVIKEAARLLECDRSQLSRRINADEELKAYRAECMENLIDRVEASYIKKMLETGDKTLMIFFLKCHGKSRGWVERQELTGRDGEPLGEVVAPVRAQSPDEWMKQNKLELRRA